MRRLVLTAISLIACVLANAQGVSIPQLDRAAGKRVSFHYEYNHSKDGGVFSSKERAGVRSTFPSLRLTPLLTNHTGAAVICEMSYADKFAIMLVKTILDTVKQVRLPELKVPAYNV